MLPRPEDQYLPKLWDIELGVTESGESRFVKLKDWRPAILVIDTPGSAKQEFIDSFKARNPPEDPAEPSGMYGRPSSKLPLEVSADLGFQTQTTNRSAHLSEYSSYTYRISPAQMGSQHS